MPIQSVKEILGHSSIQTTSDIYTHADPLALVRALDSRPGPDKGESEDAK